MFSLACPQSIMLGLKPKCSPLQKTLNLAPRSEELFNGTESLLGVRAAALKIPGSRKSNGDAVQILKTTDDKSTRVTASIISGDILPVDVETK